MENGTHKLFSIVYAMGCCLYKRLHSSELLSDTLYHLKEHYQIHLRKKNSLYLTKQNGKLVERFSLFVMRPESILLSNDVCVCAVRALYVVIL